MPMLRNGQNIGDNREGERSVVAGAPEDNNNQDLLTIEKHQQCEKRDIANLEAGREQF